MVAGDLETRGGIVKLVEEAADMHVLGDIVTALSVYQRPLERRRRNHSVEIITTYYAKISLIANDKPCRVRISKATYDKILEVSK